MSRLPIGGAIVVVLGMASCGGDDGGDTDTREFISVANKNAEFFTGASIGDRLGFKEELLEDGDSVGTAYNACTAYPAKGGPHYNCNLTVDIDGEGTVTIQGLVSFAQRDSEIANHWRYWRFHRGRRHSHRAGHRSAKGAAHARNREVDLCARTPGSVAGPALYPQCGEQPFLASSSSQRRLSTAPLHYRLDVAKGNQRFEPLADGDSAAPSRETLVPVVVAGTVSA